MKPAGVCLLTLALTGCFGPYFEHTPMMGADGTKYYLLKTEMPFGETTRNWAVESLNKRSNKICPAGYDVINEEVIQLRPIFGLPNGSYDLHWQIKCKNVS
jgi:hypothetical protein